MCSLRASNQAMKRAGLGAGVEEAESVMTELDEQIREASELTSVLATPLADAAGPAPGGLDEDLARELDMELGLLEGALAEPEPSPPLPLPLPPPPPPARAAPPLPPIPEARPQQVSTMLDW